MTWLPKPSMTVGTPLALIQLGCCGSSRFLQVQEWLQEFKSHLSWTCQSGLALWALTQCCSLWTSSTFLNGFWFHNPVKVMVLPGACAPFSTILFLPFNFPCTCSDIADSEHLLDSHHVSSLPHDSVADWTRPRDHLIAEQPFDRGLSWLDCKAGHNHQNS